MLAKCCGNGYYKYKCLRNFEELPGGSVCIGLCVLLFSAVPELTG